MAKDELVHVGFKLVRFLTFRQLERRALASKEKVQQQKQKDHDSTPTF